MPTEPPSLTTSQGRSDGFTGSYWRMRERETATGAQEGHAVPLLHCSAGTRGATGGRGGEETLMTNDEVRERQTPAHIRHVCQHSHLSRFKNQRLNHRVSFKQKLIHYPYLIEVHSNEIGLVGSTQFSWFRSN